MKYFSTNNKIETVTFRDAILQGLARDKGLFMPEQIPTLEEGFITNLSSLSFQEIAFHISQHFVGNEISNSNLLKIIENSITFPSPLVELSESLSILELFHGPTLAFKDFGARFMARTMEHFLENGNTELTILVATSGDTGSAVASGFLNVNGINVVVLFPKGKVSEIQKKQMTTLGNNIKALEIDGTFDDCQKLVKSAFIDSEITSKRKLSSANSINIGRLIPQTFYYFESYKQIKNKKGKIIYSVPSGNLGNLTAGIMSKKMGLQIHKFIAATNANNFFTKYLETGIFEAKPSVETYSNAMDVGDPSNLSRIDSIFKKDLGKIKNIIFSKSFTDVETLKKMEEIYETKNYIIDPHGAVGCLALDEYKNKVDHNISGVVLETAHPAKFKDVFTKHLAFEPTIPDRLSMCMTKTGSYTELSNNYTEFKNYLLSH
ncbi:MAG: threonine synthase [Ignavibacteriae bacterium]|nr:threonine synthase [Ignavibacteriota bacterium]